VSTNYMTLEEFAEKFEGARRNGAGFVALCPGHDDRTPSLSISQGADGNFLVHCHRGCETEATLRARGLTMKDLFAEKAQRRQRHDRHVLNPGCAVRPAAKKTTEAVTAFDWQACVTAVHQKQIARLSKLRGFSPELCQDLKQSSVLGIWNNHFAFPVHVHGKLVGAHVRLKEKWCYTPDGTKTRPLVIGELHEGDTVHVFESQWDAFAFMDLSGERSNLFITRGSGNGALAAEIPKGCTIYRWTQNDEAGEKWQEAVCRNAAIGCVVKAAQIAAPHKDLNDWLRAGATTDDLLATIKKAEPLCALPAIQDAATVLVRPLVLPPDVIEGVAHLGGKVVLGGASKSYKTWLLADLGASVATGAEWFNGYPTKKGRVLFVNFELPEPFFWNRIRTICDERQFTIEPDMLHVWNLRGHILHWAKLQQQIQADTYVLIILDPIYKLLLGRDENRAGDIASLLNELEMIAVRTGAAVVFGAHYSKGNQAQKESIDRIGGSGVFGRDPDTILNFTRHEEQDCFTVEMTLRNHPPQDPFVVRWEYPSFIVDSLLDPNRLKQAGGRPRLATQTQILDLLDETPLKAVEWQRRAREEFGIAPSTFYSMKRDLQERGLIQSIAGVFSKI